jgi:hypothetical protein
MAGSSPTQKKRLREMKLREKAQTKRDRRQQRQAEKKLAQAQQPQQLNEPFVSAEIERTEGSVLTLEPTSTDTIIPDAVDPHPSPTVRTSTEANSERTLQQGGVMASKLFVGNLPRSVTDSDLADFVTNAGFQVASAQVIRDRMTGDPKGFGFVELAEGTNLQQAIGRLNGQTLQDRQLTVNEARPQRSSFSGSRGGPGSAGRGRGSFGRKRDY